MLPERTPQSSDDRDEKRAFLQARVALFWKVLFFFMLGASLLGSISAFKSIGADLIVDIVLAVEAGVLWRLAARGRPSVRFLRTLELAGLLIFFSCSSFLPRYVLIGFARDQALATPEGANHRKRLLVAQISPVP